MVRTAFVIALVCAARVVGADPSDIIGRPLVLDQGQLAAQLTLETSIQPLEVGAPTSIAPDVWYGVTRDITVGIIHSDPSLDRIPFFFEPGTSICINRDAILCPRRYHGSGVEQLISAATGQFSIALHLRFLVRDIPHDDVGVHDVSKLAITWGALVRWQRGRFAIWADPYLQVGLDANDAGNDSEIWLPIVFAIQPTRRWAIELHTGYDSDVSVWQDGYHIPAEGLVRARATDHFDVGAAIGFSSILGPQNTPKERVLFFDIAWRS